MIPPRRPPFVPPLPTTSASDPRRSAGGVPSGSNTMPDSAPAQNVQTQVQPLPQANTASSSAAASARKRRLMLLRASRVTRPRTAAAPVQAAPAISPRSHDALRQQAHVNQAIATALQHFGMEWSSLNPPQQQALLAATTPLPPGPASLDTIPPAMRQQQQLHAILSSIQTAQDIARLVSQRPHCPRKSSIRHS